MVSRVRKAAIRAGYRSGFEKEFGLTYPHLLFEPRAYPYCHERKLVEDLHGGALEDKKLTRKYTPDFVDVDDSVWYELKGRFTAADRKKMRWVKASYPDKRIVIVLQSPNNKLTKSAKSTYAEWCEKYGFPWLQFSPKGS